MIHKSICLLLILVVEVEVVFPVLVVVFTNLPPEHRLIEIDMKDEDGRGKFFLLDVFGINQITIHIHQNPVFF